MNLLVPRPSGILLSYSTSLQKDDRWEAEGPSLPWCAMHPGEKLKMSERLSLTRATFPKKFWGLLAKKYFHDRYSKV